jgi:hypothetical protein
MQIPKHHSRSFSLAGQLRQVELWASGHSDGGAYPPELADKLVANFRKFSTGTDPYLPIPLVVGHDEDQRLLEATGLAAAGWLTDVDAITTNEEIGPRRKLIGNFNEVPEIAAEWIKTGQFRRVSIEFYEDFVDHAGNHHGPTIRRVSMLGAIPPRIKGLADLPLVVFAEKQNQPTKVLHFSEGKRMDRTSLIAGLQKLGMDTSLIPDSITDAVLNEFLRALTQASMAMPTGGMQSNTSDRPAEEMQEDTDQAMGKTDGNPVTNHDEEDNPEANSEESDMPNDEEKEVEKNSEDDSDIEKNAEDEEKDYVEKNSEDNSDDDDEEIKMSKKAFSELQSTIKTLASEVKSLKQGYHSNAISAKRQRIQAFCESMLKVGKIQPVEMNPPAVNGVKPPNIVDMLMKLPESDPVHKFSEGEKPLSSLEAQMRLIELRQPFVKFSEQLSDGTGSQSAAVPPERVREMLGKSILGRSINAAKRS